MTENTKVPQIRFKGFIDAWEQRELGELGTFTSNGVDKLSKSNELNVNLLNYMDVYNRRAISAKTCKDLMQVTAKSIQIKNNNILAGDVYFTPTSETAEDIGHILVIEENLQNTVYSYHLMRFRPNPNIFYLTFPNYGFDTAFLHKQMSIKAKGVQRFVISKPDFESLEVVYPCFEEQKKISSLLGILDHLITLHQHKYEKLVNVKKSLLEKMFPVGDEKVPKIRFNGFTDAWEQRKAKELCSISTGKSNTQDQVDDGLYPFYIRSDISVRSNKYLYDCEAVITIGDGNIGRVFHYVNGKFDLHQRCYKMTDFNGIWGKYFYFYFSQNFYGRAMSMTAKATVDSVRMEMISEMDIVYPVNLIEQKQIAQFLSNLDNLITLHKRKLEKLKNIKKSLLEKMFV